MAAVGRAQVFARGALKKGLVSRAQAEECLAIVRKLKKRGKSLPIEDVFVRKGYLNRAEAGSIAKRLRKRGPEPELALVEEEPSACPNCDRDPGNGDDCFRCGADLVTGGPGPRATTCGSCAKVVLLGTALCPGCARPIAHAPRRRRGGDAGKRAADRLILLATLAGMGYFVHHHAIASPVESNAPATELEDEGPDAAHPAFGEARTALKRGDRAGALATLEAALKTDDVPKAARLALLRAVAAVASPERAAHAAREALEVEEDPRLRLRLARLALQADKPSAAGKELDRIPVAARDDEAWRLVANVARRADGDWLTPMLHVQEPSQAEARAVALGLLERGRGHQRNRRHAQASRDLRRARKADPSLAEAHFALGLHLLEQGENDDALVALREAVRVDPAPPAPYLALGLVLERQAKTQAARASYQEFIRQAERLGGHAERVAHARRRLEALGKQ